MGESFPPRDSHRNRLPRVREIAGDDAQNADTCQTEGKEKMSWPDHTHVRTSLAAVWFIPGLQLLSGFSILDSPATRQYVPCRFT